MSERGKGRRLAEVLASIFVDPWVVDPGTSDFDALRRERLALSTVWFAILANAALVVLCLRNGLWVVGGFMIVVSVLLPLLIPLSRRVGNPRLVGQAMVAEILIGSGGVALASGGSIVASLFFLSLAPAAAMAFIGKRAGLFWAVMALLVLQLTAWLERSGVDFPLWADAEILRPARFQSASILVGLIYLVVLAYERFKDQALDELTEVQLGLEERVRRRTEDLQKSYEELEWTLRSLLEEVREREAMEKDLERAHKMEAVGKLAGGVAHDFNNLLMVIAGHVDLLRTRLGTGGLDELPELDEIRGATERGADLTRQLLSFGRRDRARPEDVDLRDLVQGMINLCRRPLGDPIVLDVSLPEEPAVVRADRTQLEQVILNLLVNARDAMPGGGRVTVRIEFAELAVEADVGVFRVPAGSYVVLEVSDTGEGMENETRERVFEPFFSTKEESSGTGLGLATVCGIVEAARGTVSVDSAPGAGATFRVFLPRSEDLAREDAPRPEVDAPPRGSETVLLAEDEPAVRDLLVGVLRSHGYEVIPAGDGREALDSASAAIDILVTDVMMPRMSGPQLAAALRSDRPELPVVFLSGRMMDAALELPDGNRIARLAKPCRPSELLGRVRALLDDVPDGLDAPAA